MSKSVVVGKHVGGSKLVSNPEHFNKWLRGENPGPLVIEVGATNGCNHNCVHCMFQQYVKYKKEKSFIDLLSFKNFLDDFKAMGGIEVYFAGNGEPLLNESLPDFIEHGSSVGLNMAMSTNGVFLTPEVSERILPCMRFLKFSINGSDRESYKRIHRCDESDFDTVIKNIGYAVSFRNEHKLNLQIVLQFLTLRTNYKAVEGIVRICKQLDADKVIIRNAIFKNNTMATYSDEFVQYLKSINDDGKVDIRWDTFGITEMEEKVWTHCYGINFRTNMDTRGNLFTCNKTLDTDSTFGNIIEERFSAIWNSERKRAVFAEVEKGENISGCKGWCQTSFDNVYIEKNKDR
ncbi:MAG: radical SAM protein [Nitrospirae bacterium]|nr:radical SAM protein [Nitrospirota bacterium]MBF0618443.1 radical SAM protein [Nitrospirota bacterium]